MVAEWAVLKRYDIKLTVLGNHLYLRNQINGWVKNDGSNFIQGCKTKLRITCSSYSEWNKILQVLTISTENNWLHYLLLNGH